MKLGVSLVNYRPHRSCEGYVFKPVCLSTAGRSALVQAGIPPRSEQALPQEQVPRLEQAPPGSRHPPGADTPPPPRSRHASLGADTPGAAPQQTTTAADGTHPTGMHS